MSESKTDSYQAEMLSDEALVMLAPNENANDEYQNTNDYLHGNDVEDEKPNNEYFGVDLYDRAAFVELASQQPGSSEEAEAAEKAEQYIAANRDIHTQIGLQEGPSTLCPG